MDSLIDYAIHEIYKNCESMELQNTLTCLKRLFHASSIACFPISSFQSFEENSIGVSFYWIKEFYVIKNDLLKMWSNMLFNSQQGYIPTSILIDQSSAEFQDFYMTWMKPQNITQLLLMLITTKHNQNYLFYIAKNKSFSNLTNLDITGFEMLGKHLQRAITLSYQYRTYKAQLVYQQNLIHNLGYFTLTIDHNFVIQDLNKTIRSVLFDIPEINIRDNKIQFSYLKDQLLLSNTLELINTQINDNIWQSHIINCTTTNLQLYLKPLKVKYEKQSNFISLTFFHENGLKPININYLEILHGLNPNEARLCIKLISGMSLRDSAQNIGVSYETARWYLKSIFKKTHTTKQTELVILFCTDIIGHMDLSK